MAGEPRFKDMRPNPKWTDARIDRLVYDSYECQGPSRGLTGACDLTPTGLLEVHHIVPRGRGGRNDRENLVTLCPAHHRWVENNRKAAKEKGLLG